MQRSVASLFIAAALTTACTATDDNLGQIDVSLVGHAASGTAYRLRDAVLTVSGATQLTFHTEDDPDSTGITTRVPSGAYTLSLAPGWRLERLSTGDAQPVEATLATPDPLPFTVVGGSVTPVTLRFRAPGEDVGLGDGDIDIGIGVDEDVDAGAPDAAIPDAGIPDAGAPDAAAPQAILAGPASLSVIEGNTAALAVRLAAPPSAPLTVTITSADASLLTAAPSQLVFTAADFDAPRTVTVQAVHDNDLAGALGSVRLATPGLPQVDVVVTVIDDDSQAVAFNPTPLTMIEGEWASFSARLAFRPNGPLRVDFTTSDVARLRIEQGASFTFTPENWSEWRGVSVSAPVDTDTVAQTHTVTASAPGVSSSLAVNITDAFAGGWPNAGTLAPMDAEQLVMVPIDIDQSVRIRSLQVTGQSSAFAWVRVALYGDAGDIPGPFITAIDRQTLPSTAQRIDRPIMPITLAPGRYWLGVIVDRNGTSIANGAPAATVRRCTRPVAFASDNLPSGPSGFTCANGAALSIAMTGYRIP
jgi:hypothetical protein